jgi:putative transposase
VSSRIRQLELPIPQRGGRRSRAGRKPKGDKAGVSHLTRPQLARRFPVHVTLRMREHVYNLRSKRCFRPIKKAFLAGKDRFGFRLNHYSVQGNHIHLIVEAADAQALARGMQGVAIRIAKKLNHVMGKKGSVFSDRYHVHILRTPSEVKRALAYVLRNAQKHGLIKVSMADPFASEIYLLIVDADTTHPPPVTPPHTWLLQQAVRKPVSFPRR